MRDKISGVNFPRDSAGAPYHLQTTAVSSRILTVGDHQRARKIAKCLDSIEAETVSSRGFTTITGTFKGVSVSIIAIGMGFPMMDMMVREVMAVINGPLKIIRLGSCSGSTELSPIGSIVVADSACLVSRNPDYFYDSNSENSPYHISKSVPSSPELTKSLFNELEKDFKQEKVVVGLNASCDSFYSSQARIDSNFRDDNEGLLDKIKEKHADFVSIEMETFQLFSLSKVSRHKLDVSACAMVFASRLSDGFISPEKVDEMENKIGMSILNALVK